MRTQTPKTWFASPERASDEEIKRLAQVVAGTPRFTETLENVQEIVLILNSNRQIVFANNRFVEFGGLDNRSQVYGMRPGEAVGCAHALADDTPAGCGTSEFCETCGAVNAIVNSQRNDLDIQECSIIRGENLDALNLRVRASKLMLNGDGFTMFAVQDISDEKRRGELEQIFFHDILNTAGGIRGLADAFERVSDAKKDEFSQMISVGASRLIDEINSHRLIAEAEEGGLDCSVAPVGTDEFLREMVLLFDGHASAQDRDLVVDEDVTDCQLETDRGLLSRVIVNMIRNALEATEPGGTVKVGCGPRSDKVCFWVCNSAVMRRRVALQVFKRSFSTKGTGRGLGTYSMRLIGEKHLKGKVSFTSTEGAGTTFEAVFPKKFS
ncbi:MAG: HAMP domain-containing histidine kinase [Rhodospirillales bacterium]|nr:HAMP domain-containing histidine kinase [Rhodospirillales bacterium]